MNYLIKFNYSFKFCTLGFNYVVLRYSYRASQLYQRYTTLPFMLFLFGSLSWVCELLCLVICLIWQSELPYIVSLQELSDLPWPDKVLDELFKWTRQRWLQNCGPEARLVGSEWQGVKERRVLPVAGGSCTKQIRRSLVRPKPWACWWSQAEDTEVWKRHGNRRKQPTWQALTNRMGLWLAGLKPGLQIYRFSLLLSIHYGRHKFQFK